MQLCPRDVDRKIFQLALLQEAKGEEETLAFVVDGALSQ